MSSARSAVAAGLGLLAVAVGVPAQEYPARAIRVVVPFAAGGGTDVFARLLALRLQGQFGQSVLVDNRAGAGGNVGSEIVVRSPPDGYTLLFVTASIAVNPSLYTKMSFDPRRDLVAIMQLGSTASVLTVHPSVPARTPRELVELSKRTRGGLNFGSNGSGTSSHLAGVMFAQLSGAQLTHIPYKGAAPAINALLSGETDIGFPGLSSVQTMLRAGKLRALAVSTRRRSSTLPGLPTLDSIYPGVDVDQWFALFAPAKTPANVIGRVHAEFTKALQHPEVKSFMGRDGIDAVSSTPAQAAEFVRREVEKFAGIVKAAGIKAE